MEAHETAGRVTVELTRDEALVLFEWLARSDKAGSLPTDDSSEQTLFWDLEAVLERLLVEPLKADYRELVAAARSRLRNARGA